MRIDPFPPWPAHTTGTLLHLDQIGETAHHTLNLQYYKLPILNEKGEVVRRTKHDRDVIKRKPFAPSPLKDNKDWVRILEEPKEVAGMKFRKVVEVRYRHLKTGEIVSREIATRQRDVYPGGVAIRPYIVYEDGSRALLYLEEWRPEHNKVMFTFPNGIMDHLPNGRQETPIATALRELKEEGGVGSSDKVIMTVLDHWHKGGGGVPGMGQLRHFFRIAIHGMEKGVVPIGNPEADERIVIKLVPVDAMLKQHFSRYTEENGYQIRTEFQEEIDWIVNNL